MFCRFFFVFLVFFILLQISHNGLTPLEDKESVDNWELKNIVTMYWTLELASKLEDAPWPATKDELIDYAVRSGAPLEVLENLQEIEDEGEIYESIEDIWPDYPSKDDFFFNEEEY